MLSRTFVFLIGLSLTAAACSSESAESHHDAATPVAVTTSVVEATDWSSFVEAGGTVSARQTAAISSRILAPIAAVHVRAGARVRKGQVLVTLDAAELQAQARRGASSLQAAELTARAAGADAASADAALELARATHARIRTLHDQRSATGQELDEARAALATAEARVAAAHAQAGGAEAALDAARAAADATRVVAGYGALTAPFDGVVAERHADPGDMAAPGVPLLLVEDPAALRLDVQLDATRAAGVELGAPVEVRIDTGLPDAAWIDGRVDEIARVDPGAHSFRVRIAVPTMPAWRSGLFGRARFRLASRSALTVPADSVIRRGQLTLIFVVPAEGVARLRAIRVGDTQEGRVEVLAGLAAGDVVIVAPPPVLEDGHRVTSTPRVDR